MNLIHDPWMPVRDAQGQRHWIRPEQLSESSWIAFDATRPDFNGALAQFAIGLLQTTAPVGDALDWQDLFIQPPTADVLRGWFEPVAEAFELGGDGPRFMQDFGLGNEGVAINDIGALLIESPGENTLKDNKDLFVKRAQVSAMCPACAALALFTLQLNAPAGGAGHRTGLRGGGPLTTLVLAPAGGHLWHDLWMNVRDRPSFLAQGGDATQSAAQRSFPWLGPITTMQTQLGELTQAQVHPAHLYWAMPRRIRLAPCAPAAGECDVCSRTMEGLFNTFAMKNYGLNYKGAWAHPLSPYYEGKEGWLPVHPQPDGLGYKHWLGWVLGVAGEKKSVRVAAVVERALMLPLRNSGGQLRLWVFGHDMDNMKARCWYESTLPLYGLADCAPDERHGLQAEVSRWLAATEFASYCLRSAVKDACFSANARGDFGSIDAAFWATTEPPFYRQLQALIEAVRSCTEHAALPAREAWHKTLAATALRLFDHSFAGAGAIERQNPKRIARAHKQLRISLYGPKLRQALGLPISESAAKPARKTAPRKPATPTTPETA